MRQHRFRPSQCFVLIKQSDSPCLYQFLVGRYIVHDGRAVAGTALPLPVCGAQHGVSARARTPEGAAQRAVPPARNRTRGKGRTPDPKSQSLSRSYRSNLPTSLTYIPLSTRGCSPWRPAAVIGTAEREHESGPWNFQGPSNAHRTASSGHCSSCRATRSPEKPIPGSLVHS